MRLEVDDEIILRPYIESDAKEIFGAVKENYDHLYPFLLWVEPEYSVEMAKVFIKQSQKDSEEKKRQGFGIFSNEKLIGSVGFNKFDWMCRKTEIGYWLAKDFSGKGIITKACKLLINYAFDELDMNRIEIRCADANVRSRAIPERLGFKLEGVLRQSLYCHSQIYDDTIYGLLKEEWNEIGS